MEGRRGGGHAWAPRRFGFARFFLLPFLWLLVWLPGAAAAQVLEIGEGGAVTVHDRPAVYDDDGSAPIEAVTGGTGPRKAPVATAAARRTAVQPTYPSHLALLEAAQATGLSPDLLEAVAWQESRMRAGVISRAGAIGEMQLMPGTARDLGVNPYDTRQNIHGGARYLSGMMRRYNGDLILALAAYNAGPGTVDRYRGVPPYRETREYVAAIMHRLSQRAVSSGARVAVR